MSQSIPNHYVLAFNSNVFHLSQQKGSRLIGLVRKETLNAEKQAYDHYSASDVAKEKAGRFSNVEYSDMEHGRRWVSAKMIYDAKFVDNEDKLKMIHDPTSEYTMAMQNALGRKMDKIILEKAFAPAYVGKDGDSTVAFPVSQEIACFDGTTLTGVGLNSKTLKAIRKKFSQAEAIEDGSNIKAVITAEEVDSMLDDDKITNSDFAVVKALAAGLVTDYMGFNFTRTELVNRSAANVTYNKDNGSVGAGTGTITAAKSRMCLFFATEGILFATAESLTTKISELPEKHYAKQLYCSMNVGAVRMEEVKVMKVYTSEK